MTLKVQCKNCGEQNDVSKWTEWLRKKVKIGELYVYQLQSTDITFPKCINCHIQLSFQEQQNGRKVSD